MDDNERQSTTLDEVERAVVQRVTTHVPLVPIEGAVGLALASSLSCASDVVDVMLPNAKVDPKDIALSSDELQAILTLAFGRPPKPVPLGFADVSSVMATALTSTLQDVSTSDAWARTQTRLGTCLALHMSSYEDALHHLIGAPSRSDDRKIEALHYEWSVTPISALLMAEVCLSL
jgi:hypothetical protein